MDESFTSERERENHDRFVRDVRATGLVWGLSTERGWAVCESAEYEEAEVYPFWSDEAGAKIHCTDEWADYVPTKLALDRFLDTWLPGMSEDGVLVGTNWDAELAGMEVEPEILAQELLGESPPDGPRHLA
jgi:hypothetical protein